LPGSPTNTVPLKSLSQPSARTYAEKTPDTRDPSSLKDQSPDKNNRTPPVRSATVGCNVQTTTPPTITSAPSQPLLNSKFHQGYNQETGSSGGGTSNYGRPTVKSPPSSSTPDSLDEWDSIERELLGTIEEDNVIIPKDKLNTDRLSSFGEYGNLLQVLLQNGLTAETILNSSEEELVQILERSNTANKTKEKSNQEMEDRLSVLEKLLGDIF